MLYHKYIIYYAVLTILSIDINHHQPKQSRTTRNKYDVRLTYIEK